jgi:hypothetical protein
MRAEDNNTSGAISTGSWVRNLSGGMSWTSTVAEDDDAAAANNADDCEEAATVYTNGDGDDDDDDDDGAANRTGGRSRQFQEEEEEGDGIERIMSQQQRCSEPGSGMYICQQYKLETLERQLFNHSPGAARRASIIEALRQCECNFTV